MYFVWCRFIYVITFAMHSFWVPQIVSCVKNDARQPLKPVYIIGISVTRLALPLYIYGCPKNLLEEPHSPTKCLGLCVFVAAQVWHGTAPFQTFTSMFKYMFKRSCMLKKHVAQPAQTRAIKMLRSMLKVMSASPLHPHC